MIVFQVSLNFDPVKEILKILFHIYILMKKVVILRKILCQWSLLCSIIRQPFQFEPEQNICVVIRATRKNIYIRAYSRTLLGAIITPNLLLWVLQNTFSFEIAENDICLGGYKQANALFSKKMCPQKTHSCLQGLE